MRRPRVRLRTLMIAVAVAGALLGYAIQRERYLRLADLHYRRAHEAMADTRSAGVVFLILRMTPRAAWHFDLARKFERAARFPWFAVAPDRPEPD